MPIGHGGKELMMDIAVLLVSEEKSSVFEKNGIIKVFSKQDDGWVLQRARTYDIQGAGSADAMRSYLSEVAVWLGDCKNFLAKRMRGIHLAAFEKYQISFWEIDGSPEQFFDYIQEAQSGQTKPAQDPPDETIKPVEQKPGYYFVDLREVMNHKTSLNSRQVLEPFLRETSFLQLEVVCNHVPKWLEDELPKFNLFTETQTIEDCVRFLVFPAKQ
jgi:Fe-only nitrogenase accessory protein AnfO